MSTTKHPSMTGRVRIGLGEVRHFLLGVETTPVHGPSRTETYILIVLGSQDLRIANGLSEIGQAIACSDQLVRHIRAQRYMTDLNGNLVVNPLHIASEKEAVEEQSQDVAPSDKPKMPPTAAAPNRKTTSAAVQLPES